MEVHVLTHTHWDREWYQPLGRFRQRLVTLIDELLDEPPAAPASFLLDGQAVVLEDYLSVRPERRAELAALLREGRLEAGPWYVLADNLIPGGEALVRNLLAGRRTLRALRAEAPPVLYCPDSFGHPAIMPALAAGFGFSVAVVWRGYGGARWPAGDAARWAAPDGAEVLLYHLPPDGYEFGSNLPADADAARERWRRMRAVLAPRSTLSVLLVQNGADHHARQHDHDRAVDALVRAGEDDMVRPSSLRGFATAVERAAAGRDLPRVAGELRDSYGYTWTLQGTFGTRAYQKRINAQAERLLVRDAEPWAAMARARGAPSRRALTEAAWRTLLECHPHDTLCGCSIDAVADAADMRWADAIAQGDGIRDDALHDLLGHDPARARSRRAEWTPTVIVRNAAARPRGGIARLTLDSFVADVGVGPASAGQRVERIPTPVPILAGLVTQTVADSEFVHARLESPRHYPDDDLVERRTVLAWVPPVPAYGLRTIALDAPASTETTSTFTSVMGDDTSIANGRLRIELGGDGIALADSDGLWKVENLVRFECRRDEGDLYTPSIRGEPSRSGAATASVTERGPLRGSAKLSVRIAASAGDEISAAQVTVSLEAQSDLVRIAVSGDHRGRNQRLRVVIATGIHDAIVHADAAFGPVTRTPLVLPLHEATRELPPPTQPLHRYVTLDGAFRAATLFSDGLGEYELSPDGDIAVTLVRAVGELSCDELPERPGHAGWPTPTPSAQCQGPFAARFALLFHPPGRAPAVLGLIERTADDALLPLIGTTSRDAIDAPGVVHGLALDGDAIAISAVKESEDGEWTVVRIVNVADVAASGALVFGWPVTEVRHARLDETPVGPCPMVGGRVTCTLGPREICTLLVR